MRALVEHFARLENASGRRIVGALFQDTAAEATVRDFGDQLAPPVRRAASLRATKRAIAGPVSRITTNLVVCIAMTYGMSTLLEAAMIAAVSAPPGLVARYAVSGSTCANTLNNTARPPQIAISRRIEPATAGSACAAWLSAERVKRSPIVHPTPA